MNRYLAHLIHSMRRYRRGVGFAAVVLLTAGWGGLWLTAQHRHQPPHAKQHYQVVRDRAAQICSALGSSCEMDPLPVFSERPAKCYVGDVSPLRMWKFNCQVDGRPTWLIFDDDTAKLCYLVAERTNLMTHETGGSHVINTRAEAAEAGFQDLKALKLLGRGMLVALHEQPHMNSLRNTWQVTWSVRANAGAAPYTVHMELDRATGKPLGLVDTAFQGNSAQPSHS